MKAFCISLSNSEHIEDIWQQLENEGIEVLYSLEEPGEKIVLYAKFNPTLKIEDVIEQYPSIEKIDLEEINAIDWRSQWEAHAPAFEHGYSTLRLSDYGYQGTLNRPSPTVKMIPGSGFGDLSHPTTCLVLKLMCRSTLFPYVVDMGCGSGVISICAIAMGASKVIAIEIDNDAIKHAEENIRLNNMGEQITFSTSENLQNILKKDSSVLLTMNMIKNEQIVAYGAIQSAHAFFNEIITSGILYEEREAYLKLTESWGWKLCEEINSEGWCAFRFIRII